MRLLCIALLCLGANAQADTSLIGGRDALPGEYPEVVYISSGTSRCSATIIGPRTILTAAHCISNGGEIRPASFVINQTVYKAKCQHHPLYNSRYSYDFALCKVDKKLDVAYASISSTGPAKSKLVTLMGYGCTQEGGTGGGNDGTLRVGNARVIKVPDGKGSNDGQYYYTSDKSSLCPGDSGGPSMLLIKDAKTEHHYVSGVNSRGNFKDRSLLSSVFLPGFQDYARRFEREQGVEICGLSKDCDDGKDDSDKNDPLCEAELANLYQLHALAEGHLSKLKSCLVRQNY